MKVILALVGAITLAAATGRCTPPCEKLEQKLCQHLEDKKACERTKKDLSRFHEETCDEALEIFEEMVEER